MSFTYRARDPLGNVLEGTIDASSSEDATQQLRRDGFNVLEVNEEETAVLSFGPKVKKDEVIYFTTQLAIMVDTGVTLSAALASILEQEKNGALKRVLKDLRGGVEAGEDFSTALSRHPKLFDSTYVSLVRASESTGSLGSMLERIAQYQRKELEMRGKVRSAMAYPMVMVVIALGVTTFLLTWVLPRFMPLFNRKGVKLPKITSFMMTVSDSLTAHWYFWLISIAAAGVGFVFFKRSDFGRHVWDWTKLQLPILGNMFRKVALSRSIRTLGSMLNGGVPMLDAIALCRDVSGNYLYEAMWNEVLDEVTAGKQICDVIEGNELVPPTLVQMIRAGEDTASLGSVLERVSGYYDQEVETSVKAATSMIEPIMIAIMGVVVGGIGLSLLLPIFTLSGSH